MKGEMKGSNSICSSFEEKQWIFPFNLSIKDDAYNEFINEILSFEWVLVAAAAEFFHGLWESFSLTTN